MNLNTCSIANYLLLPVSGIFYLLSLIRRYCYKVGLFKIHQFTTPVIVIGNITVGGSGKTPIVMSLIKHFKQQGKKVGVVSRGYAGKHKKNSLWVNQHTDVILSGDEPLLIACQSYVPVVVNKNRAQAVKDLINQYHPDLILSDDGLQHYAMGRKIEITVIYGIRRFGNGFLLPAGPLRETVSQLGKVDFVINNGASHTGEFRSDLSLKAFINVKTGVQKPLDYFNNTFCHGVAGIGHPQSFFNTLTSLGIQLQTHLFTDHYVYQKDDLSFTDDHPILMTSKDCVKCNSIATNRMWYLQVEANLNDDFLTKLDEAL